MKANEYFKENLLALKNSQAKHEARAKWEDGTTASKTSIYQVFEKYGRNELPIHTYRDTAIKSAIQEMLWIYKDQTSCLNKAHERGIDWWDNFDVGDNTIGKAYGYVVNKNNLINNILSDMVENPFSQRHMINLWDKECNDYQIKVGGLVPCAFLSEFNIIDNKKSFDINDHLQIRSSDYITAGAINRIQYYCLGLMICGHLTYVTGLEHNLNDFSVFTMDLHIYDRHEFAIDELLNAKELITTSDFKGSYQINLKGIKNFYDYDIEDFEIQKPKGLYKLSKKLEIAV